MSINIKLPYIQDMRQGLGLHQDNNSKDEKIAAMDPFQRTKLIAIRNLKDPDLADDFKSWFESQGIILVDKSQYINIDIFLKNVDKFIPEDPTQANRYMIMVKILKEIFSG